jgi:hypothetical protein
MPKRVASILQPVSLPDIAAYQQDADSALRLLFTDTNPDFVLRFVGYRRVDIAAELTRRLDETDLRSSLTILARLEAAFRIDYKQRCAKKKPDPVSIEFRALSNAKGRKVALEDEIWEIWRNAHPSTRPLISELRSAFKFRHWLAHGRYWQVGRKYDFRRSTSWRMQFWPPFRFMGEAPLPPLWK